MPSKLKKAIAAVKDQTSISLAMVKTSGRRSNGSSSSSTTSLEVAILKATSHDDSPVSPHHLDDILRLVASDHGDHHASVCARSLGRRVGRTRSWMVALKSLLVVLRLLQSPAHAPLFSRELLHAMKTGYKILNLQDAPFSSSSAAAFVRSFAAFLNARLLLAGRAPAPDDLSPAALLLDRVPRWQHLLDKAMAVGPVVGGSSRLVVSALHAVARESVEVYRELSDGLALLLDGFFHLQHASCVAALEACVEASRQFEQLREFYRLCWTWGAGTPSEYPDVKSIPRELMETLKEFLKDQSSFPATAASGRKWPLPLLSLAVGGPGSSNLITNDEYSDPDGDEMLSPMASVLSESDIRNLNYPAGIELLDQEEGEALMLQADGSSTRDDHDQEHESGSGSGINMESLDRDGESGSGWEVALLQNAMMMMQQPATADAAAAAASASSPLTPNQYNNPFLHYPSPAMCDADGDAATFWVDFTDNNSVAAAATSAVSSGSTTLPEPFFDNCSTLFHAAAFSNMGPLSDHANLSMPTINDNAPVNHHDEFQVPPAPTFKVATQSNQQQQTHPILDPFGSLSFSASESTTYQVGRGPTDTYTIDQHNVKNQQQRWLEIQNKILAKHFT